MSTKTITYLAVIAAIIAALTMFPQIPAPATEGFIHLGDTMIYVAAALFNPFAAALAAGVGSMMADILSGYMHWAIPTLIIKSSMALIASVIMHRGFFLEKTFNSPIKDRATVSKIGNIRTIVGMTAAGLFMIAGYYVAASIMKGSWLVPIASIPLNFVQFIAGSVAAFTLIKIFKK